MDPKTRNIFFNSLPVGILRNCYRLFYVGTEHETNLVFRGSCDYILSHLSIRKK